MGIKGSGKSTSANFISDNYNLEQVSFATHLKDLTASICSIDRVLLEGDTEESRTWRDLENDNVKLFTNNQASTPREALVFVAEELIKPKLGKDYFCRKVANDIKGNKIITDMRFIEEYEYVKDVIGLVIRIDNTNNEPDYAKVLREMPKDDISDYMVRKHPNVSNGEWDIFKIPTNHIINNNNNKDHLYSELEYIMADYGISKKGNK